jgi:coniferyl-aldehyde dehydrogenase
MNEILTVAELDKTFSAQKKKFSTAPYLDYSDRIANLKNLKKLILDNQDDIIQAISDDFGHRCKDDSIIGDILSSVLGINYTLKKLKSWMKPNKRHVDLLFQPAKAQVLHQPLGVVGIIVPWNYPLFLAIGPLTAALAAGNCAMLKMSEYTPRTSTLLASLCAQYFDHNVVAIVGGEADIAMAFSKLPFNHLFFTGSTNVGRLVMKAAAENLVPVTLELGGKSPSIIDADMDIKTTVSRFIMGKILNSGQTCVAPDYILCPRGKVDELVAELKLSYKVLFPTITDNNDCSSIVNEGHYARLQGLLTDAKEKGANLIPLSDDLGSAEKRKMPLTVIVNSTDDMAVMTDEIFGPILPIVPYDDLASAINYINDRPRPLALYIFSFSKSFQQTILKQTHAGGVCINEATIHVGIDDLPFGGIGASGMGSYHGAEGFKTFSHAKSILSRGRISLSHLLLPPYGKALQKLVYKLFIR